MKTSEPTSSFEAGFVPIRVVSQRTGVSPEVLRAWERRYDFPRPHRTPGGARAYSFDQVIRLELMARAMRMGWRPHELVPLPVEHLRGIVVLSNRRAGTSPPPVTNTLDWMVTGGHWALEAHIRAAADALSAREFVTCFGLPLVVGTAKLEPQLAPDRVKPLYDTLAAHLYRMLGAQERPGGAPLILIAGLPGDEHTLALALIALYLAGSDAAVRMLGPHTPPEQIVAAANAVEPDVVAVSVATVARRQADTTRALGVIEGGLHLRRARPGKRAPRLWVGGAGASSLELPGSAVRIGPQWTDIDAELARVRAR
jgi:hypothetical protein